ncbi:DMT family transporter [Ruegeria sediminis]|uniref:DMT family transporter n=1 Tax=Ruegeria sediminis TaxID=2583820 RepID=A0ABY2WV63_9RHOB|nr:DMT family transporter [Ruegeria sediminis]TMV06506.1 DMT family transporter [Ruegeria sediminis]
MENLRGALLMTLAMLGFAFEDMFIKLMAGTMAPWQIILFLGAGGAVIFAGLTVMKRQPLFSRGYLNPMVLLRNLGELVGTLGFVTAIALTPISQASAILQATPLAVTLGAALFLKEPVGWRRWSAIIVGFLGVMLVIRPGTEGFDIKSLFAVQGVVGLAIRDLATRRVPRETTSFQISFLAFLTLIPASFILAQFSDQGWVRPTSYHWLLIVGAVALGVAAYYAIVAAMRIGEVSFVTPFRYSRMLFALVIGVVVFKESPDAMMLTGAAVIVGSGIYTLWRERKKRPAALATL